MSSATLVPETRELTGDDAWKVLTHTGCLRLLKDAWRRMRVADGFSHSRSLAYLLSLVAVQGLIGLVGLSRMLHRGGISRIVETTIQTAVPGPAGRVLTTAVAQANHSSGEHHYLAIATGLIAGIFTATVAMGQVERGLNRIYGIEQDRPSLKKYGLALVFALAAGTLVLFAFTCLALGSDLLSGAHVGALASVWVVARWPLGVGCLAGAVSVLFHWSPRRKQPASSWLLFGSGVSVVLVGLATAGLGLFFQTSSSFGSAYGPLAGVVALLLWCLFSAMALFYGASVTAQLEATQAGLPPQDATKVEHSDPVSGRVAVGATA